MTDHGWHRALGMLALAFLFASWMAWSWFKDPFDPTLGGTDAYGHNGQGALGIGLALLAVEAGVATLALVPWKRSGYALSAGAFTVLLAPWVGLWFVLSMHAGGVIMIHLMWLVVLWLVMVAFTIVGGVRAIVSRARRTPA
jgi:hypothetical protein